MANFNQFEDRSKKYFKQNYIEVLEMITPKVYLQEDQSTFGLQVSPIDQILKSHIDIAKNFNTIFDVSGTTEGSALRQFSGIASFFIKQNNVLDLDAFEFEKSILLPLGKKIKDFATSADFYTYITSSLLPNIRLNHPNYYFNQSNSADAHDYLINTLSWLYLLNLSGASGLNYQPSAYVANLLTNKLYYGESIKLNDAIKGLQNYIWRNYSVCSLFSNLIPPPYFSGTQQYTSGIQSLSKLETLLDVIYSPLVADSKDTRVQEAFDNYISVSEYPQNLESSGAFRKLLTAISYGIFDVNDEVSNLLLLHSIDDCPDQYLPYLAELIGWELIGPNQDRWRMQLKNAVAIYKAKGTKGALDLVLETLFGVDNGNISMISSDIKELWESYIPNLLYYALATETSAFSSFDIWTRSVAQALGIQNYSDDSMDTNIRFVVDDIIKHAAELFPNMFFIGNKPFGFEDETFVFKYRGRVTDMPPWELEKYYRYCALSQEMLDYFYDRLICLGVRRDFADALYSYIEYNVLTDNKASPRNAWLFFTFGNELPPNYDYLLSNLDKKRYKFLPLWNGKSSHFNLALAASSFNINTDSFKFGSFTGLQSISRAVNLFTPAHAIPNIDLNISDFDFGGYNELVCENVVFTPDDFVTSGSLGGYELSGMNMSSLGRIFTRTTVNTLEDSVFASTVPISNLKRNFIRRRGFKNLIPKDGWYYRDGFNMPPYLATSDVRNFGTYMPLGYIPSSAKYVTISSYNSLPQVYTKCEDLNSSSVINGVSTSSTFPCRGMNYLLSSCDSYSKRGDAHPIIGLMHKKMIERAYAEAEKSLLVSSVFNTYQASAFFMDIARNLSNASGGPSSINSFLDFEFGRGIHKTFKSYITYFSGHEISENVLDASGGPNLISHAYGPLVYNGFFDKSGSAATSYNLITTSLDNQVNINSGNGSGILSILGVASGTYIASTTNDLYIQKYEFRNPHILSGIEFVQTSGDSESNSFTVYNLAASDAREYQENFANSNPLIKLKSSSFFGLPRLRFNLRDYSTSNFLIPEHEFELNVRAFVGKESGGFIGGGAIGVWIHTNTEGNYVWSYDRNYDWVITNISNLTLQKVQDLSHFYTFPLRAIPDSVITSSIPCINQVFDISSVTKIGIDNLVSDLFEDFIIKFNTHNPPICIPNYYSPVGKQVHTNTQGYTIEVFMLPDETNDTYTVLDFVSAKDLTINQDVSSYNPNELLTTLRYFIDIASDKASRQASITSGVFETSGGSRINYRYHPDWGTQTKSAGFNQYTEIDIYR